MNQNLKAYQLEVRDPGASGPELLQMLHRRDKLADIEATLLQEDRDALRAADLVLLRYATEFSEGIARCTDLAEQRRARAIPPSRWWWYLDVISHLPIEPPPQTASNGALSST
jgi:hypothetical protein